MSDGLGRFSAPPKAPNPRRNKTTNLPWFGGVGPRDPGAPPAPNSYPPQLTSWWERDRGERTPDPAKDIDTCKKRRISVGLGTNDYVALININLESK